MKILLVDDDTDSRMALASFLRIEGHQVTQAVDGDMGLHAFEMRGPFDVVVTDYQMPKKNGALLMSEIRKQEAKQPIVFMSADWISSIPVPADVGKFEFLHKVFNPDDLLAAIARAVGKA